MSLEQEAKAAAEAEYPVDAWTSEREARPNRIPFAHGYQRGYEAGVAAPIVYSETVTEMRDRLVDDVMTYAKIEGLSEMGIAQAALRMGITAQRNAERRGRP